VKLRFPRQDDRTNHRCNQFRRHEASETAGHIPETPADALWTFQQDGLLCMVILTLFPDRFWRRNMIGSASPDSTFRGVLLDRGWIPGSSLAKVAKELNAGGAECRRGQAARNAPDDWNSSFQLALSPGRGVRW